MANASAALRNDALAGPSDRHERARSIRPIALVGSAKMDLQAITSLIGQARDELAGRAVAAQERTPVILEVGEFRADDEIGLLDLLQADPSPQVGHLARAVERPEQ